MKYYYYKDRVFVRDSKAPKRYVEYDGYIHPIDDGVVIGLYKTCRTKGVYRVVEVKTGLSLGSDVYHSTLQGAIEKAREKYESVGREKFLECVENGLKDNKDT